jgi:hypothetical protein
MGDRAQVKFIYEDGQSILFYTHWYGSRLPNTINNALVRGKDRWTNTEYLARIVFSEMIIHDVLGNTGFGIGFTHHGDVQHDTIVIDTRDQTVDFRDGKGKVPFSQI